MDGSVYDEIVTEFAVLVKALAEHVTELRTPKDVARLQLQLRRGGHKRGSGDFSAVFGAGLIAHASSLNDCLKRSAEAARVHCVTRLLHNVRFHTPRPLSP